MWWYAADGYREEPINQIILIGFFIIILDLLTMWALSTNRGSNKKKNVKNIRNKKGKR